jgi:formyltetrahydrofolate hydrolase
MNVEFSRMEDNTIQFECTDYDGVVYGVADTLDNGAVVDTLVVHMETYDEIQDSELFKRIVCARAQYINENIDVFNAIREFV